MIARPRLAGRVAAFVVTVISFVSSPTLAHATPTVTGPWQNLRTEENCQPSSLPVAIGDCRTTVTARADGRTDHLVTTSELRTANGVTFFEASTTIPANASGATATASVRLHAVDFGGARDELVGMVWLIPSGCANCAGWSGRVPLATAARAASIRDRDVTITGTIDRAAGASWDGGLRVIVELVSLADSTGLGGRRLSAQMSLDALTITST